MKVGTDAVLLGAFANATDAAPQHILDIGTGCGLIALMLAQRFPNALIDAIDLDADSILQAQDNFAASPWSSRLQAIHTPLQSHTSPTPYQLIVSNPPYFTHSLHSPNPRRTQARHNDSLPFADLNTHTHRLISPDGTLVIILPHTEAQQFQSIANSHLHLIERISIAKRDILFFSTQPRPLITRQYTLAETQPFTQDFYL